MTEEEVHFRKFLEEKKLRLTKSRSLILNIFLEEEGHISAEELYGKVVKRDSCVGIATVYRTLKLLKEAGLAQWNQFGVGEARYEHSFRHAHHDHLICEECGNIVEFESPRIESIQEQIAAVEGFTIHSHRLEIYGICSQCKKD